VHTGFVTDGNGTATRRRHGRILGWIAGGLAVVLALLLLTLSLIDLNLLKRPIERIASARSGRSVLIGGRLEDHVWSWTPGITINGLTVGNPPWDSARPMLQVRRLQVRVRLLPLLAGRIVIEHLEMDDPVVYLHRGLSGRANWTSEILKPSDEPARPPHRLPLVHDVLVSSGKLTLVDEILRLNVEATLQAHAQGTPDEPRALHIEGKGTVNRQPLEVQLLGGPLLAVEPGRPYPFDLQLAAGNIRVESSGVLRTALARAICAGSWRSTSRESVPWLPGSWCRRSCASGISRNLSVAGRRRPASRAEHLVPRVRHANLGTRPRLLPAPCAPTSTRGSLGMRTAPPCWREPRTRPRRRSARGLPVTRAAIFVSTAPRRADRRYPPWRAPPQGRDK
jgi:AsmA-like protein